MILYPPQEGAEKGSREHRNPIACIIQTTIANSRVENKGRVWNMPEVLLVALRSLFAFTSLFILILFLRNKHLSQFTFIDYVVGITIGSIAASLSVELENRTVSVFAGLMVWGLLPQLLGWYYLKYQGIRRALDSGPTIVIKRGKILEENLQKEFLNLEDLQMHLRIQGIFNLNEVEFAVMEKNGQLSVLRKRDKQPLTLSDLGVKPLKQGAPLVLISDGRLLRRTLATSPYTEEWLLRELEKRGIRDISQVVLAQVDTSGLLYVDLREDQGVEVPPISRQEEILANLEKGAALLETFALETKNPAARDLFRTHREKLTAIRQRLQPYLRG